MTLAAALEHLVSGIVDHPDQVTVDHVSNGREDVLRVHVGGEDRGRVIGRSGRTAQAIRIVMNALAGGRRVRVDVADD